MTTSVLTERQRAFLILLGRDAWLRERFVLSGGTALAGFHLQHRYSEDLDFFSEEEFDANLIMVFFRHAKSSLGFLDVDYEQSYNRNLYFLRFDGEELKMEFTYYPFPKIEEGLKYEGVHVDSLLDIAVNKLFTIYQQPRARDYVDLFCICGKTGWTLADLQKKARVKFDWHIDPLQLGMQFLKAMEVKDYPRMITEVPQDAWQGFFVIEAKKLGAEILE